MKHYICLQSMGDNLISLYLLKNLEQEIIILGTRQTEKIAKLIGVSNNITIEVVFENIPAFYDIRRQGIFKGIRDLLIFRKFLKNKTISKLIFEKKDLRTLLIAFNRASYEASSVEENAYVNRKKLLEKCFSKSIILQQSVAPVNIQTVLIAPSSALRKRNIKVSHLDTMIQLLSTQYEVKLIDYQSQYRQYMHKVDAYYDNISLEKVKQLIIDSDLFIGTDSFLIHLAYYYQKAFFIIFNFEYYKFLPPYCEVMRNYIITNQQPNLKINLQNKFKELNILP